MGWDGPTWVVCGTGMGREAGTPFTNGDHMVIHKNRDGMGWDETNVSHGGGTPLGLLCHWQCGIVREIQHGTTRPQQPTLNEKQTIYAVIICRLLSYSVFSKDEGLHQTKSTMPPNPTQESRREMRTGETKFSSVRWRCSCWGQL